ncbi:2OG-Fe(II) oxygenase [Hydrogenophaga sp. 5NK40-0174]|uniref:2OG-Fe(II) oxygenase n=1 Tax=Hydrogenophaga sp. 5NK40-0174 TaxID=3127649 RepID=UPI003104F312
MTASNNSSQSAQQAITPELRDWIVDQAAAGFPPEKIIEAMIKAGWQESVAEQALEVTLSDYLRTLSEGREAAPAPKVGGRRMSGVSVTTKAMPDVDLETSPRILDLGDRQVEVLLAMRVPRIVVLGGFLSDQECDALVEAAVPRMKRSLTVATQTGGEELNPDRTSDGMFFSRGESELISAVESRIARLLNWPEVNGEGLQVLNYQEGAEYKAHYDYFDPNEPGTPAITKRGGQRVGTMVMYLNNPALGGGTIFPDVSLEVAPQKGNAVFFNYSKPHPSTRTLHGGSPVTQGEKWVATKWLRERQFS